MKTLMYRLSLLLIGLFTLSCVSRSDMEELKAGQRSITATQKKIITKLEAIAARPAAEDPQPGPPPGPDLLAAYAFPVGNSPFKGPKDALVTIIEVSDFQ